MFCLYAIKGFNFTIVSINLFVFFRLFSKESARSLWLIDFCFQSFRLLVNSFIRFLSCLFSAFRCKDFAFQSVVSILQVCNHKSRTYLHSKIIKFLTPHLIGLIGKVQAGCGAAPWDSSKYPAKPPKRPLPKRS